MFSYGAEQMLADFVRVWSAPEKLIKSISIGDIWWEPKFCFIYGKFLVRKFTQKLETGWVPSGLWMVKWICIFFRLSVKCRNFKEKEKGKMNFSQHRSRLCWQNSWKRKWKGDLHVHSKMPDFLFFFWIGRKISSELFSYLSVVREEGEESKARDLDGRHLGSPRTPWTWSWGSCTGLRWNRSRRWW